MTSELFATTRCGLPRHIRCRDDYSYRLEFPEYSRSCQYEFIRMIITLAPRNLHKAETGDSLRMLFKDAEEKFVELFVFLDLIQTFRIFDGIIRSLRISSTRAFSIIRIRLKSIRIPRTIIISYKNAN